MPILSNQSKVNREHEVMRRAERTQEKLEKMGVRVIDTKFRAEPRYHYSDYYSINEYNQHAISIRDDCYDYTVEWTVGIGDRTMSDIVDSFEKLDWIERKFEEMSKKKDLAETDLRSLRERVRKLELTLKENPGIRDQWDEMMTMLKLAGYTDDLID